MAFLFNYKQLIIYKKPEKSMPVPQKMQKFLFSLRRRDSYDGCLKYGQALERIAPASVSLYSSAG
jgi:hypothetical protein